MKLKVQDVAHLEVFVWQHLNRQKCGFYVTKKNTEKQWDKSHWFVAVKEMALFGITSVNGILSQTSSSDLFWQCWECGFLIWQTSTDSSNILPVPSYPVPSYPIWTSGLDTSPPAPESLPAPWCCWHGQVEEDRATESEIEKYINFSTRQRADRTRTLCIAPGTRSSEFDLQSECLEIWH